MSFEADQIVERRRLKHSLIVWRLAALALLAAAAFALLGGKGGPGNLQSLTQGEHIARLQVNGIIVEDIDRELALADAADDDDVRALILRIDSPGGTVVGGESLYRSIRAVAERKPVVAVMGATATSAGYMIALAADRIVAAEGSLTGSIGVLLQTADVTGLLEKIGILPETIKSGPLKAQPNPLEKTSPEARQAILEVVMDMHAMFVDMVAERRKMERPRALGLADGRVFTGRQALRQGLIDGLGGEAAAVSWLVAERMIADDLPVVELTIGAPPSAWSDWLGAFFGKTLFSERLRLDGLISLWHPESN